MASAETSGKVKEGKGGASMGFGGVPDAKPQQVERPAPSVVDAVTGRPVCPRHNSLMKAYSTGDGVTRYKCQAAGCEATQKVARKSSRYPGAPLICQRQQCRAENVAMEVDAKASNYAQLKMVCPRCRSSTYVGNPEYEVAARRAKADDFAAR